MRYVVRYVAARLTWRVVLVVLGVLGAAVAGWSGQLP